MEQSLKPMENSSVKGKFVLVEPKQNLCTWPSLYIFDQLLSSFTGSMVKSFIL